MTARTFFEFPTTDGFVPIAIEETFEGSGIYRLSLAVTGGGGGSSLDRELVVTTYQAKATSTNVAVGDTITATRVLDVSGSVASQVGSTIWRNETTGIDLSSSPPPANTLNLTGQPGLTDAQLRASALVVSDSTLGTGVGALTEAAPASDTASSGLNGRLQRIAQRITGLIALLPASLGAKTGANSLSVVPASDATFAATIADGVDVAQGATTAAAYADATGAAAGTLLGMVKGVYVALRSIMTVQLVSSTGTGLSLGATNADAQAVSSGSIYLGEKSFNYVFNNTSFDRQRGDTNGTWVGGNVASGVADAGFPVKVGGVFNTSQPVLSNGQRGDLQLSGRGVLYVVLSNANGSTQNVQALSADAIAATSNFAYVGAAGLIFNGTSFDRQRGDTTGTWMKAAPQTGTDRSITATTTSQQLMAATTARSRFFIKNDSAVAIWINLGATAVAAAGSGNIAIAANGGYFELVSYNGAVNIIAASGTAAITAREFV